MVKRKRTKVTDPKNREVKRLVGFLLRDLRPEYIAVKLGVTVYTVYRWAKGATACHPRHLAAIQRLAAVEEKRRAPKGDGAAA